MSTECEAQLPTEEENTSEKELTLPEFDLKAAKDAVSEITKLYTTININSYPDHYMSISDIYKYSQQGYDQIVESMSIIRVISDYDTCILQHQKRSQDIASVLETETDPARVLSLKQQLQQHDKEITDRIKETITRINNEMYNLTKSKRSIEFAELGGLTTKSKGRLEKRVKLLETSIENATEKINEAQEMLRNLENSLAVLTQNNLQRISITIHGHQQDLSSLGIPESNVPTVQATLEVFRSNPQSLGDVVNQMQLTRGIEFYRSVITDYTRDKNTHEEDHQKLKLKMNDLMSMAAISEIRLKLTGEMHQLLMTLDLYKNKLESFVDSESDFDHLAQAMNKVKNYLEI